jgi:hypothetical protein
MAARCCLTVGLLALVPLFDVGGYANGFDVREFQAALVAPVEELLYRARELGHPGIAVTDWHKAAARPLAAGG